MKLDDTIKKVNILKKGNLQKNKRGEHCKMADEVGLR